MKHSPEINEIAAALAEAQAQIHNPTKSADNPFFKSKYADLAEVLSVVRPAFSAHKLSVVQFPFTSDDGQIGVTTMISHASGQWMQGEVSLPLQVAKNVNQDAGSAITYLRRYALSAACGVAQEDNDANLGKDNTAPVVSLKSTKTITFEQAETINKMILDSSTDAGAFCQFLKIKTIETMPPGSYDMAFNALTNKMKKLEQSNAS